MNHLTVGLLLLGLVAPSAAGAQPLTFARDDHASHAGARGIASADFDRDGWPDVAHANTGRNTVTILLNGRGALASTYDLPVGAGPFDLTTGDYNRDGIPDLAVANADGHSISILLGRAAGGFTRADIPAPSQNPRGITTADVNNDAKPDLIYTGYAQRLVQVLVGTGTGVFTRGASYISAVSNPQGLDTADFNRDGFLDIAVAYASSGGMRILYGNGGASFYGRTIASGTYLNVVAAGDFDADGWPDVAAASTSSSTVGVYRGGASGLLHAATYHTGASPRGLVASDVNGDGALDLVTANRAASTVSVLQGDRAHPGGFLPHLEVGAGTGSRDAVAADFDADGRLDLATGNEYMAGVTVLTNTTLFTRAAYAFRHVDIPLSEAMSSAQDAWSADFNRDGRLDLATIGATDDAVTVLLTGAAAVVLPAPGRVLRLAAGDFNADGKADVLHVSTGDQVAIGVYLGDGRGGFGPSTETPLPWAYGNHWLAIGDLNRDGRPDIVGVDFELAVGGYVLGVMIGRGDGTFAPGSRMPLPDQPEDLTLADTTRDGILDVVLTLSGYGRGVMASVNVWPGDGAGGLGPAPQTVVLADVFGVDTALGDLNHDGYLDIVVTGLQHVGVALGGASGFAGPSYTRVTEEDFYLGAVALADLNVDGRLDAAVGWGELLFGSGDGTLTPAGRFDYAYARAIRLVDFTRDGLPDILAAEDYGRVRVLANRRTEVNQPPTVDAGPDRVIDYALTQGEDCDFSITAAAIDPDAHALTYEWRRNGETAGSNDPTVYLCAPLPGTFVYSLTVGDGRGGEATDTVTVTILPVREIVLWTSRGEVNGNWSMVEDSTAAGGQRAYDRNLGAPKSTAPLAEPASYLMLRFVPDPTRTYKLWIRLRADGNSWANDSVLVQFSGATDLSGDPQYRIGTASALAVSLEECVHCGVAGWGWEDDGWGAPNRNGVLLRFQPPPDPGEQFILIQTREDGVSIDQVVLSAEKYLTARPGAAKNDATILTRTYPPF